MYLVLICLLSWCLVLVHSFQTVPNGLCRLHSRQQNPLTKKLCSKQEDNDVANDQVESSFDEDNLHDSGDEELNSPEIRRLIAKIADVEKQIENIASETDNERKMLEQLNKQYGGEIARIKKEFARMKERSYEESVEVSNQAKMDALKEVLPITDNYYRVKQLFSSTSTDKEAQIIQRYTEIFEAFAKVIEDFGVVRVQSVGQPFDFRFMEAIMTAPSTEYAKDFVSMEYQIGYKMGDKCVRPAMVVVSLGPGPAAV
ncbi:nucleotide exchange factor GrpE [archaeon]|nr:MAG: nucleotide exchange factor GrpE [archaeon]